jgi:DNA repair protein RecN (Recombination protein N)
LFANAAEILRVFEEEDGIPSLLGRIFRPLRGLNQTDTGTAPLTAQAEDLQDRSGQFAAAVRDYLDSLSFEPNEAEQIKRRYDFYEEIRRKYGDDLAAVRDTFEKLQAKLQWLKDLEYNDAQLRLQLEETEKELCVHAGKLTAARRKTAEGLKAVIERELKDLGITRVSFEARVAQEEFHKEGRDRVAFYISPNVGEDLKPLAQIVSSGEAARVMLALKRALVKVDPVPVLIFDEIDAQIGGRLGSVTGQKLKSLSENRQVLLITHLPQIAAFADKHFKVVKDVRDGRTLTQAVVLDRKERVDELAHMMSGDKKGPTALRHATEMLAEAGQA